MSPDLTAGARFNPKPLFLPYYLPALFGAVAASTVAPILPLYAQSLGAGIAGAGAVVGMIGLGALVGNIPAGVLIPRLGPKRMLVGSYLVEASAFLLAAIAPHPLALMLLMFVTGVAHAMARITQLWIFRQSVPTVQRGRALSLLGGDMRMGFFLGPMVGGVVTLYFGYPVVFVASAGVICAAAVMSLRWLPSHLAASPEAAVQPVTPVVQVLRENLGVFSTAGVAIVALQVMRFARQVVLPLWGVQIGIDVAAIGSLFSIMYGMELLLFYPAGHIMDRFGRKATGVPAMVILAASLLLTPLVHSYGVFVLVVLLSGIGNGLGSGINMTLSTDYAPDHAAGQFLGIWRTIGDAGTAAGPVLIGVLGATFSLALSPVIVAGIGLAGAAMLLFLAPASPGGEAGSDQ
jgi:MFS family permease